MAFVEVDGFTVHYRLSGRPGARRVMFLNALGSDLRIWDDVAGVLGPHCEMLTCDMRGHGLTQVSSAPYSIDLLVQDAVALLDAMGWPKVSLVGLSVGGLVAQGLAARYPDRVEALVLMDTAAKIGTAESWNERIAAVEAGGVASIADGVVARWVSPSFAREKPAVLAGWKTMLVQTRTAGYAGTCAALRDADLTLEAAAISAPTLVLAGDGDLATPPDLVEATARLIPGARFQLVTGAGHLPCLERPGDVAQAIRLHLEAAQVTQGDISAFDAGMAVRRVVLGDEHVDCATAAVTNFDAAFQHFITESAWGRVWSGSHFTLRERSIVTIALLAALGHDDEVAMHVRATAHTGADADDIAEALMHVAVYAGVPAANHAIKLAKATLAEMSGGRETR